MLSDLVTPPPTPAVLPASGPKQEQRRFFVALTAFFTKLATGHPLVLVVKDIHWSDESSQLEVWTEYARLHTHRMSQFSPTKKDLHSLTSTGGACELQRCQ